MIQDNGLNKTKNKTLYNDICSTCNYGELCVSKKTRRGPVRFCEEFDDHVPVREQNVYEAGFQPAQSQSRFGPGVRENVQVCKDANKSNKQIQV